jgi:hypothetical protein
VCVTRALSSLSPTARRTDREEYNNKKERKAFLAEGTAKILSIIPNYLALFSGGICFISGGRGTAFHSFALHHMENVLLFCWPLYRVTGIILLKRVLHVGSHHSTTLFFSGLRGVAYLLTCLALAFFLCFQVQGIVSLRIAVEHYLKDIATLLGFCKGEGGRRRGPLTVLQELFIDCLFSAFGEAFANGWVTCVDCVDSIASSLCFFFFFAWLIQTNTHGLYPSHP